MIFVFSISAFAELGKFIESPSNNPAPELISAENESEDCVSRLIITAYIDRAELSEEARQKIEKAYTDIIGTQDLSSLNEAIADIAKKAGMDPADLAVSDLFDITGTDCDGHGDHGHFNIKLKAETLENFVCLLHYYDNEWHIVENAEVTNNGEHLEFDEDQLSPFAIVVYTGTAPVEPDSSNSWLILVIVAAVIVAGGITYGVYKLKKKKA